MKLKIEEVKNLIKMLSSEDSSNHEVVFEILNKLDFEKNLGEILIIIKKAAFSDSLWILNCKDITTKLSAMDVFNKKETSYSFCLTFPELLEVLMVNNCSSGSKKLYKEVLNDYVNKFLKDLGYDMNHVNVEVTLKNIELITT